MHFPQCSKEVSWLTVLSRALCHSSTTVEIACCALMLKPLCTVIYQDVLARSVCCPNICCTFTFTKSCNKQYHACVLAVCCWCFLTSLALHNPTASPHVRPSLSLLLSATNGTRGAVQGMLLCELADHWASCTWMCLCSSARSSC